MSTTCGQKHNELRTLILINGPQASKYKKYKHQVLKLPHFLHRHPIKNPDDDDDDDDKTGFE